MLQPFEFAILTLEEASKLLEFIEKSTALEGLPRNYEEMQKRGVLDIYVALQKFEKEAKHYQEELQNLDTWDFVRKD